MLSSQVLGPAGSTTRSEESDFPKRAAGSETPGVPRTSVDVGYLPFPLPLAGISGIIGILPEFSAVRCLLFFSGIASWMRSAGIWAGKTDSCPSVLPGKIFVP